jgi:hypothetical protein
MAVRSKPAEGSGDKPTSSAKPKVPRAVYTIKEFCEAHRISEAMYYKLRDAGLGPREMRALRKVTISVEAAAAWRRERESASSLSSDAGQS